MLKMCIRDRCGDMMIKVDYPLKTSANEEDWVDIEVNKNNKTVNIIWRLAVSDGAVSYTHLSAAAGGNGSQHRV